MEYLINVGYAILGALGLVVFLVVMWFAIGIAVAMYDIFFKRKRTELNFVSHEEIIKK